MLNASGTAASRPHGRLNRHPHGAHGALHGPRHGPDQRLPRADRLPGDGADGGRGEGPSWPWCFPVCHGGAAQCNHDPQVRLNMPEYLAVAIPQVGLASSYSGLSHTVSNT